MLSLIVPSYGHCDGWRSVVKRITKQMEARPEIVVQSESIVILIFGMEKMMKRFEINKITNRVQTREIKKLEDSTKSPFHQTPEQRLNEAIAIYEGT